MIEIQRWYFDLCFVLGFVNLLVCLFLYNLFCFCLFDWLFLFLLFCFFFKFCVHVLAISLCLRMVDLIWFDLISESLFFVVLRRVLSFVLLFVCELVLRFTSLWHSLVCFVFVFFLNVFFCCVTPRLVMFNLNIVCEWMNLLSDKNINFVFRFVSNWTVNSLLLSVRNWNLKHHCNYD